MEPLKRAMSLAAAGLIGFAAGALGCPRTIPAPRPAPPPAETGPKAVTQTGGLDLRKEVAVYEVFYSRPFASEPNLQFAHPFGAVQVLEYEQRPNGFKITKLRWPDANAEGRSVFSWSATGVPRLP